MIDLTKYSLEELQNKIKKTVEGDDVEIYAIYIDQDYPILGAILRDSEWVPNDWTRKGVSIEDNKEIGSNLDLSAFKPEIDYNQLPVDTLIEVEGFRQRYLAGEPTNNNGLVYFYDYGGDSITKNGIMYIDEKKCKLITNPRKGWFGGEIGIPDGVRLRVWKIIISRSAVMSTEYSAIMNSTLRELFNKSKDGFGITSYQILGEDYQEGDEL